MSATTSAAAQPESAWPMFRAMVGVGVLCGLLIVTAFQATRERIARNQAEALRQAIFRVLPGAATSQTFRFVAPSFEAVPEGTTGGDIVYAGYDEAGERVGVAIQASGMGYQDTIVVLYGYAPERDAIVGFEVLASKETPGLGDKISVDPAFLANFERLAVALDAAGSVLAHAIAAVKHGEKRNPWEIDGITGATVSSKAIARLLDASAALWAPRIRPRMNDFDRPKG